MYRYFYVRYFYLFAFILLFCYFFKFVVLYYIVLLAVACYCVLLRTVVRLLRAVACFRDTLKIMQITARGLNERGIQIIEK